MDQLIINDVRIEAAWHGPAPDAGADPRAAARRAGLCRHVARFSRKQLAERTGCGVLVYSRRGYGKSDPRAAAVARDLHARRGVRRAAARARPGRHPQMHPGRPQRRRLDRHDLRRRPPGFPRARPRADGAAFLRRGRFDQEHRRGEGGLRERRPARAAPALSRPCRGRVPRLERRVAQSAISATGASTTRSPTCGCRCSSSRARTTSTARSRRCGSRRKRPIVRSRRWCSTTAGTRRNSISRRRRCRRSPTSPIGFSPVDE